MTAEAGGGISEDALLGGTVRLRQPRRGHRAGTDAVLLAALADAIPGDHVVDVGAATGAVGLMVASRVAIARITLIERDPLLVGLARENIALNGLEEGGATVIEADAFELVHAWAEQVGAPADLVVSNPPFFEGSEPASPTPRRKSAHAMSGGRLADWVASSARLLKNRGRICLIYRADGLPTCLDALADASFGSIVLTPIYPRLGKDAVRLVVSAILGGRSPPIMRPGLVLHGEDGRFTPEAARLHGAPRQPEV